MEPRISLVTLGVADIERARRFYDALGWSGISPDGDVVFYQAGGMVLALWSRELLAADSTVTDRGGWGGVTLAHNVAFPDEVDAVGRADYESDIAVLATGAVGIAVLAQRYARRAELRDTYIRILESAAPDRQRAFLHLVTQSAASK